MNILSHNTLIRQLIMCRHYQLCTCHLFSDQLPFISLSLVKSRSKFSTSASPAVRLANSWMSRCVIGSMKKRTVYKYISLIANTVYMCMYYIIIQIGILIQTFTDQLLFPPGQGRCPLSLSPQAPRSHLHPLLANQRTVRRTRMLACPLKPRAPEARGFRS